jgi:hypothetical protein
MSSNSYIETPKSASKLPKNDQLTPVRRVLPSFARGEKENKLAREQQSPLPKQELLHKEVGYKVKGSVDLLRSPTKKRDSSELTQVQECLVAHIEAYYEVPRDFDLAIHGPISDVRYEQRLIIAYGDNKLQLKDNRSDALANPAKLCTKCALAGHLPRYCRSDYDLKKRFVSGTLIC